MLKCIGNILLVTGLSIFIALSYAVYHFWGDPGLTVFGVTSFIGLILFGIIGAIKEAF